jgi:hypothetical protein
MLQKPNECFDDSVLLTRFKLDEARAADERAKEHNDKVDSRAAEYALTSGGVPEPRQAVHFVASLISTAMATATTLRAQRRTHTNTTIMQLLPSLGLAVAGPRSSMLLL